MEPPRVGFSLSLLLIFCSLLHVNHGTNRGNVSVVVPEYVIFGQTVHLYCKFPHREFYTLKWFLNEKEIYRLVPGAERQLQRLVFNQNSIRVDLESSKMIGEGEHLFVIQRIATEQSGTYKCQITENSPPFQFHSESGNLTVMILPDHYPVIAGMKSHHYFPGDRLNLNCSSSPSYPAATLTWYLNSRKARNHMVTSYMPRVLSSGLEISVLGLNFGLQTEHWERGKLTLTCSATLPPVRDSEIRMDRTVEVPSLPQLLYSHLSKSARLNCDILLPTTISALAYLFL